jgi:hypothetical protein
MDHLKRQVMPSSATKNIFLGTGGAITRPYKWPPFTGPVMASRTPKNSLPGAGDDITCL